MKNRLTPLCSPLVAALCFAFVALVSAPGAARADDDEVRCGDKIKKKDVTVYEIDFHYENEASEKVLAEHGVALEEVLVDTVQSDRKVAKEALARAARMGCPYVVVGPQKEEVVAIRYESRGGGAATPREVKAYRALVVYAVATPKD